MNNTAMNIGVDQ